MKKEVKKIFGEIKKETFIGAAAVIVLGVLLLFGVETLLCEILGVIGLVIGIVYLLSYVVHYCTKKRIPAHLFFGMSFFTFGCIFYFQSGLITKLLSFLFAAVLILDGTTKLDDALALLPTKKNGMGLTILLFALAALALGFLILFDIISGPTTIGLILVLEGVLDIVTIILLSTKVKKSKKATAAETN